MASQQDNQNNASNADSDPYSHYLRQSQSPSSNDYYKTLQNPATDELINKYLYKAPALQSSVPLSQSTTEPLRQSIAPLSSQPLSDLDIARKYLTPGAYGYPYTSYPYDRSPYATGYPYTSYPYDRTTYDPLLGYGYPYSNSYPYSAYPRLSEVPRVSETPKVTETPKTETTADPLRASSVGLNPDEFFKKYGFFPSQPYVGSYLYPNTSYTPYTSYSSLYNYKPSTAPLTLAYWAGVQGLVQTIRYLLEYTDTPYVEKLYENREDWLKDKPNLGIDFANLPYVIGDKKVAESIAILNYIPQRIRRPELVGKNDDDKVAVLTIYGVLKDVAGDFGKSFYEKFATHDDFLARQKANFEKNHNKLLELQDTIGSKDWLFGYATYVDFQLFYFLDQLYRLDAEAMKAYPGLKEYFNKIENIPQIRRYRESGKIPKYFGGPQAYWRG